MKNKLAFLFAIVVFTIQSAYAGIPIDSVALKSFVDGLITDHLKSKNIAGATICIVKDGKIFFAQGYGFSDVDKQIPVDPAKTLFRIGSISKLFVWTSVMQLKEQGKLNLDVDINLYLKDFKIPATFEKPIILRHLMTHTPGFEDRVIGLFAKDDKSLKPLGEILKNELPERVRPAGEVSSYSNHGTGIAAYIVEQVSGMSFKDYVKKNIILPLGMEHFSFEQPLPESMKEDMSKGYNFSGGRLKKQDFEYVPLYPVGAASSSAIGIANFMIAHLQNGRLGKARILDSLTVLEMHSTQFRHAPDLNGFCLGFMEFDRNGIRIIAHGGDTFWFHSVLALLPEQNIGIFLSLNTSGGSPSDLAFAIIDHYFPAGKNNELDSIPLSKEDFRKFGGFYRSVRYPVSDISKLIALSNIGEVKYEKGELVTSMMNTTTSWLRTGDLTFREKNGKDMLEFRKNADGRIEYMFLNSLPYAAIEKIPPMDTPFMQIGLFIVSLIIFFFTILYWPVAWFIRRKYVKNLADESIIHFKMKIILWASCIIPLFYLLWIMAVLSDSLRIVYGIPMSLKIAQALPVINLVLILLAMYFNAGIWKNQKYYLISKIHYSLVTLTLILFEWQLFHWNLLGWKF